MRLAFFHFLSRDRRFGVSGSLAAMERSVLEVASASPMTVATRGVLAVLLGANAANSENAQ